MSVDSRMVIIFPQHLENIIVLFSRGIMQSFLLTLVFHCFFLRLWMFLRFVLPMMVHWLSMKFLGVDSIFTDPV